MAFEIEIPKRGGASLFKPFHLLKVIYFLQIEGTIGRKNLAKYAGVGEGTARNVASHLVELGYAKSTETGLKLTRKGTSYLREICLEAAIITAGELTLDNHDFAIKLSGLADKVKCGIKERDEAIKVDATGATTILFQNGKLHLPDHYDVDTQLPEIAKNIRNSFSLKERDVIVIGTGPTIESAQDGAFAAAVCLISNKKNI